MNGGRGEEGGGGGLQNTEKLIKKGGWTNEE